jgi:hypothetical protein
MKMVVNDEDEAPCHCGFFRPDGKNPGLVVPKV